MGMPMSVIESRLYADSGMTLEEAVAKVVELHPDLAGLEPRVTRVENLVGWLPRVRNSWFGLRSRIVWDRPNYDPYDLIEWEIDTPAN